MAATPVDRRVADHQRSAAVRLRGNAHSVEHSFGDESSAAMGAAASSLVRTLGGSEDVTFTPGASAALWLAVEDAVSRASGRRARIAVTAVEHPALLAAANRAQARGDVDLSLIPVDATGAPDPAAVARTVASGVDLVCTMAANNEVGTITDMAPIRRVLAAAGVRHLVDASQAAGRIDMSAIADADLIVVSGAKAYGPRRTGALIGRLSPGAVSLAHDVFGSPDAAAAAALAYALELRAAERDSDEARICDLRDRLQGRLHKLVPGLVVNGDQRARLAGSLSVSAPSVPGDVTVSRLWGRVAVSTGAACQSGVPGPSHVLSAMGLPGWVQEGTVRIGVGRFNDLGEIDEAAIAIAAAMAPAQAVRRVA